MTNIVWQQSDACPIQKPFTIYKASNSQGDLYIGRTKRGLKTRLAEHARNNAPWLRLMKTVQITCVKTLENAKKVEKKSIAKYCPPFNIQLVPERCKIKSSN